MLNIKKFKSPLPLIVAIFSLFIISSVSVLADENPPQDLWFWNHTNYSAQLFQIISDLGSSNDNKTPPITNRKVGVWRMGTLGLEGSSAEIVVYGKDGKTTSQAVKFDLKQSNKVHLGKLLPNEAVEFEIEVHFLGKEIQDNRSSNHNYYQTINIILNQIPAANLSQLKTQE